MSRRLPGFLLAYAAVYAIVVAWWGALRTLLDHGSRAAAVTLGLGLPSLVGLLAWWGWARWASAREGT